MPPKPSRKYNFADPDSRVRKDDVRKCFVQAHNVQAAAESHAQVIVAAEVTQEVVDLHQLVPMVKAVKECTGGCPEAVTADPGYVDTCSPGDRALNGCTVLVAPDRKAGSADSAVSPHAPYRSGAADAGTTGERTGQGPLLDAQSDH
jgi:hypothetical protein